MILRVSTLIRFARACALGGAVSALAGAACAKNDGAQGLGPSTDAGVPDGTSRADAVPEKRAFCTYSVPPFEIDRGVRGETGVTLVPIVRGHEESSLADGGVVADGGGLPSLRASVAVGYAKGFGTPRAVELGADGVVSPRNVPSRLESLERRPERGVKRAVLRVVPRAVRGADILVSVDTVELGPDKTRHVFCGAAEGTPYVAFDGPSLLLGAEGESETIACRTVLRGREHRALESQVTLGGSRLEAQLVLEGRVLGAREVTLKAQEKPSERYAFTDLGFVSDGDRGLVTARYDGGVVEALVRGSEPSVVRPSPLGREAWTFATSATPEGFVTWATTAQKPGLFRALASAPGAARPAADAAEITAIEGLESAGDERTFVSASTSGARTWVTFVERAEGRRRGVLVGVDGDRARGSFVFGASEADLLEARAIELRTGVVALVYLTSQGTSEATLTGAVVTCPDAR